MHRLARQARISSLSRYFRTHRTNTARLQLLRVGHVLHRYYSHPSSKPEFESLLASITPDAPDDHLVKTISLLLTKITDPKELEKLNDLLCIYAYGLDGMKLSERFTHYMNIPPGPAFDEAVAPSPSLPLPTPKFDEDVHTPSSNEDHDISAEQEEVDGLSSAEDSEFLSADDVEDPELLADEVIEDYGSSTGQDVETPSPEQVLQRAEAVLAQRKFTEDVVAKALASLVRTTADGVAQKHLMALPQLFAEASRRAMEANAGVKATPLFTSSSAPSPYVDPDSLARYIPWLPSMPNDGLEPDVGNRLDEMLASPDNAESLASVVSHLARLDSEAGPELAPHLKQLGFNISSEDSQSTSFQSALNQASRESDTASVDTNALAGNVEGLSGPFPDLMTPDPLMDSRDVLDFPPDQESPYHNRVVVRNHSSIFHQQMISEGHDLSGDNWTPEATDETEEEQSSNANLPLGQKALSELYRFPIFSRRITQQTGKGKIHRIYSMVIVGNGDGLVGYGEGKDEDAPRAEAKAFAEAVQNMDWVERFEKRTVWTEMETKLGATRVILRPRPVGFGLRCNPNLHQVLKAAGIKDISAKVWGSRNPINVIKAAFRMLQAGNAPLSMGDGVGGKGRKLNKGSGARSMQEVERERGRKLISLRK